MRSTLHQFVESSWRGAISGVEQMSKMAVRPVARVLSSVGGGSAATVANLESQIERTFETIVDTGEELQLQTLDLAFDVFSFEPLRIVVLERLGIRFSAKHGHQTQAELEYLKAMNDAGPGRLALIVLLLAVMYSSVGGEEEGVERFEGYLERYDSELSTNRRAVYLCLLGLLRVGSAQRMPLWNVPGIVAAIRKGLAEVEAAKEMTKDLPDVQVEDRKLLDDPPGKIVSRWVAGLLYTQLPWPFGNNEIAKADLEYIDLHVNKATEIRKQLFFFLPEVYFQLAIIHRDSGDQAKANEYLSLSGFKTFDKQITVAAPFGVSRQGLRVGVKAVTESPGNVFTVSGQDMSEFNFVVSADEKQLIAIDMGSRPDTAEAAYRALVEHLDGRFAQVPDLSAVFVTHAHWDHVGGHEFYKKINPNVRFYSRDTYKKQLTHSVNQPPPFHWFLGEQFDVNNVAAYVPDVLVSDGQAQADATDRSKYEAPAIACAPPLFSANAAADQEVIRTTESTTYPAQRATREMGGTKFELILPSGGGGETPDGMFIYMPEFDVLFPGDFVVPWVGTPYVVEGDIPAILASIDLIVEHLQPSTMLYGHEAVTVLFGTTQILQDLKTHLSWLYCETLRLIYANNDRPTIQSLNLIPPDLTSQPEAQLPYILMREVFINRVYEQHVGYWGPQLQNSDYLSDGAIGAVFSDYLGLSEWDLVRAIREMGKRGDHELAGRVSNWVVTQYPDSKILQQVRHEAFLQLKQKWQQLNPFKFVMYSETIDDPTPLAGNSFAKAPRNSGQARGTTG